MIRILAVAIVATALLPASAEAKRRYSGSKPAAPAETQAAPGRGFGTGVAVGAVAGSRPGRAYGATQTSNGSSGADPTRVPFPPSSAPAPAPVPTLLSLTASQGDKVWCRSEVVVGGFCVLN
jgi:hypothetical protein